MPAKNTVDDLALLGGIPSFAAALHVGRPNIASREHLFRRISDILDRKWLSNDGVYLQELEATVAQFLGVRNCVAICNGTVALEILARAAGLTGEVIVPSMTFVATAHALEWVGLTPVFCDVDPTTHNIDPAKVEALITPRTSAILAVHLWGRPCDVEGLTEVAKRHGLALLFDGAHAFGCSYQGRMIGNFGQAEMLSFHATKFFNTLEGGAIVTNDDAFAERARQMRNFGFAGYDNVISVGINGKMNEVSAAMGLTGLESLDEFISVNYRNYKTYQEELRDIPGVRLLSHDEGERSNYQYIVVEIDEAVTRVGRDRLLDVLHAENVLARRYFYPGVHRMEPYRTTQPNAGLHLPETEALVQRTLVLPTGTGASVDDIRKICEVLGFAVRHGAELREQQAAALVR